MLSEELISELRRISSEIAADIDYPYNEDPEIIAEVCLDMIDKKYLPAEYDIYEIRKEAVKYVYVW
jgi:hypothetical protein